MTCSAWAGMPWPLKRVYEAEAQWSLTKSLSTVGERKGAPVLLDFGAGPRIGEAVVQLPGVRRLRVERQAGPGVVVSGDYASWETRGSLRGVRVAGLVGQIPKDPGAREVLAKCLHDLGPSKPWALVRQVATSVADPWE